MSVMLCSPDGVVISTHSTVAAAQTAATAMVDVGVVISWTMEWEGRYVGTVGTGMVLFVIEGNGSAGNDIT